ncbi:MAG TPA: Tex family protein [Saprospiraceae bacterium]|nr:Tex family protein [Saprospiraceae bacterium]
MIAKRISDSLGLSTDAVSKVLTLLDAGSSIPFIARYRKEATGSMDEVVLSQIQDQYQKLVELDKRRESILESISEQGKLTPELKIKIEQATSLSALEDLYLPYKPKRKTRADVAKANGLEPLAKILFQQRERDPEGLALRYVNDVVPDLQAALAGARDIIAEWIHEDIRIRQIVRKHFSRSAVIQSKIVRGKEDEGKTYRDYFQWSEALSKCPSHRLLAMRRGEDEGFLRLKIEPDSESCLQDLRRQLLTGSGPCTVQVNEALEDAYKRLLQPAIETEFRQSSKEKADAEAIAVFTENLKQLLLASPLGEKAVMGIDPGFRTGCKIVCLDRNGLLKHHSTIFPHPPQEEINKSIERIRHLVDQWKIEAIAIGNGTAGRETLDFLRTQGLDQKLHLYLISESGASIYSASETAREEFPDLDLTVRGAISIGRRLMDPLAELVKLDPKSIGVGQYQHDVHQKELQQSLDRTISHCVNRVGINLNTASKHLLQHVSGLGPALAQSIVNYREKIGRFENRQQLKQVPRLGEKAFEQCAGFLRIRDAENPLDNTAVHPERYGLVKRMASELNCPLTELIRNVELQKKIPLEKYLDGETGLPTLKDILNELEKPGLDPRGEASPFEFSSVRKMEDLHEGMTLPGIITNITQFGAFVNIGLKENGFIHISQLADRFVKNPLDVVHLQQQVSVRILSVDIERKRIACSLKKE